MSLNGLGTTWPYLPQLDLCGTLLTITQAGSATVDISGTGGGDPSTWSQYPATQSVAFSSFDITGVNRTESGIVRVGILEPQLGGSYIDIITDVSSSGSASFAGDVDASEGSLNATALKTNGISSYDAGARLTTFETGTPPFVAGQGLRVYGDVIVGVSDPGKSLQILATYSNLVGGFYKTSDQSAATGGTTITWDDTYAWSDALNCFTINPGTPDITCNISGVYEISVNLLNSSGTSVAAATNTRTLAFDLTRGGSPVVGFVVSQQVVLGNAGYNQLTQGLVQLAVGDVLNCRVSQTLTSGSTTITATSGDDPNTWMTYNLKTPIPPPM